MTSHAGQRAFPWPGAQLALDGHDDAPGHASAPEAAPAAEPSLGPLHAVSHHPPGPVQLDLDLGDTRAIPQLDLWARLDLAATYAPPHAQLGRDDAWHTRAAKCHRTRRMFATPVPGFRTERGGWSFAGLVRCGHWSCPACGVERAREVSAVLGLAIERWLGAGMGLLTPDVWMLSLTMPHGRADHPGATLDGLFAAWEAFTRSRTWRKFRARWGVSSVVRVLDVTFGGRNGCHPHFHVALFPSLAATAWRDPEDGAMITAPIRGMLDDDRRETLDGLAVELRSAWGDALRAVGVTRGIAREALELTGGERAAAYFTAWGLGDEVGASTVKTRSHLRLLDAADVGHVAAGAAYTEFCQAVAGRQWVSSGLGDLKQRCGIDDAAIDAYRQRRQAERDAAAAARGEPVVFVRPLEVTIPALLYPAALRHGWRAIVATCNQADADGRDPQAALVDLLRGRPPPAVREPDKPI